MFTRVGPTPEARVYRGTIADDIGMVILCPTCNEQCEVTVDACREKRTDFVMKFVQKHMEHHQKHYHKDGSHCIGGTCGRAHVPPQIMDRMVKDAHSKDCIYEAGHSGECRDYTDR